jgi:radical SAM superfamily enzyme YgiQ (UPF0313 family)
MKSMLFVIPWSGFYIGTNYTYAEAPERAPEGVVGLATYLKSKGASVMVADMQCMLRGNAGDSNKTLCDLWSICEQFHPDIIGFSFFTARFEYARDIFVSLSQAYESHHCQKPLIIAGGVHPTLLPKLTLEYIPFDALVIGEGEYPLLQLLQGDSPSSIKGVFLPNDSQIIQAEAIKNLDELPIPDWGLIDKDFYAHPSHQISNTKLHRVMPITFGRGCMYRCNFCAHSCFLYARCHSADYFIEKMNSVAKQCHVNTFVIQDSSIGNFQKVWSEVCQRLIEAGSPYRWWANLRANQANAQFLQLMKDAGCIKLFFGFESGSPRVLQRMNKLITVEQCKEAARMCHEIGIPFYTSYIVNYFDEEEADLELTEQLILETHPTSLAINCFSPIPGSKDYSNYEHLVAPYIKTIHDWTTLGMLISPRRFGNMSEERFNYWFKHLREMKKYINAHENNL